MMGVAEKKRTLLIVFPPEVWALIFNYLPGEVLCRFKLAGSALLWRRLSAVGSVRSLFLGEDGLHFKRWPTCLNELGSVKELNISNINESWWQNMGLKLDQVPKTLKKLVLQGPKLEIASIFCSTSDTRFSLDEHLPLLEELSFPLEWLQRTELVASNLKVLRCRSWDFHCQLPPSLIHLYLTETIYPGPNSEIRVPQQLETISALHLYQASQLLPHLPTSLLTLDIYGAPNLASSEVIFPLPKGLKKLSLTYSFPPPSSIKNGPISESLSFLPSHLADLNIGLLPATLWKFLPATLHRLRLTMLGGSDIITCRSLPIVDADNRVVNFKSIPLSDLPKTITSLTLLFSTSRVPKFFVDFDTQPDGSDGTATATTFKLNDFRLGNAQLSARACRSLSLTSCLTHLDMNYLDHSLSKHLPRTLTKLIAMIVIMTPELIEDLPRSLTFLHLGNRATDYDSWIDPLTSLSSSVSQIMKTAKPNEIFWTGSACLPPNLTSLNLYGMLGDGDLFALQDLKKLTFLSLQGSSSIPDFGVQHLSRVLVHLHLPQARNLSGKCFKDLPKSLTWLSLEASFEIYDHHIQHLPRTLRHLNLQSALHLTDSCLKSLPRSLRGLDLSQNEKITNSHLSDLPVSLRLYPDRFKKKNQEEEVVNTATGNEPSSISNQCTLH